MRRGTRTRCRCSSNPCFGKEQCVLFSKGWNDFQQTFKVKSPRAWASTSILLGPPRMMPRMTRFIEAAAEERAKVGQKSTVNPGWSALALAEAWCVSRLGLSNGNMNRLSAVSVISAIEAFASGRQRVA